MIDADVYDVGDTLVYQCNDGFSVSGSTTLVTQCQDDIFQWSLDTSTIKPVCLKSKLVSIHLFL